MLVAAATLLNAFIVKPLTAQEQQFAELGECLLESGEVIQDCRIGYRAVGKMKEDRSNVILFPTWYGGSSDGALFAVHPENGFIDPEEYYVIFVDAFGNGVSSSPSNSPMQPGSQFPTITIRDMVRQQHRLLTEVLGMDHLLAVTGISMGGMQSFEWAVAYPGFAEKIMPIVGSPRLAIYDIVLWETQMRLLEWAIECECQSPAAINEGLVFLMGNPDYQARVNPRKNLEQVRERIANATMQPGRAHDLTSQAEAMVAHDVSAPFGGDMRAAAARVQAEMLVVVGLTDHVVTPGPAIAFADLVGAPTLRLDNDCGHSAYVCAPATFRPRAAAFLAR
ncbi:MAG: alpha/beta fold hydrolase [Longimicrobiales bacterium]